MKGVLIDSLLISGVSLVSISTTRRGSTPSTGWLVTNVYQMKLDKGGRDRQQGEVESFNGSD